jgi:hypothetical protein
MPLLNNADSALTPVQRAHLQRWRDDDFARDWQGVPGAEPITPDGMDRAALDAAVGGSFFPGIEAGGLDADNRPILARGNYAAAFRIDHARVTPGTISASMALPWQADFLACADNWWPVPRPNRVIPEGSTSYESWDRGINDYQEMVAHWHTLGFVVRRGTEHVEVGRCSTAPSGPSVRPLVTGKVASPPAVLQRRSIDTPERR